MRGVPLFILQGMPGAVMSSMILERSVRGMTVWGIFDEDNIGRLKVLLIGGLSTDLQHFEYPTYPPRNAAKAEKRERSGVCHGVIRLDATPAHHLWLQRIPGVQRYSISGSLQQPPASEGKGSRREP